MLKCYPKCLKHNTKDNPQRKFTGQSARRLINCYMRQKHPLKRVYNYKCLDNALIFLIMYLAFNGIAAQFSSKNSNAMIGITSIVITVAMAGVIMTYPMRYTQMPKEQRPPFWKMALIVVGLTLAFVAAYGVTILIPGFMNPVLPAWIQIVIAALLIVVRIYIKRRYKITGTFFG
ncbi:DUF1129 family protein [Latilactobacillus sakei]